MRAYRVAKSRSERNRLYTLLRAQYYPRIVSIKLDFEKRYWNDIESQYDFYLLQCIDRWDESKCQFSTYLYSWITAVRSTVITSRVKRDRRERWTEECDTITKADFYNIAE